MNEHSEPISGVLTLTRKGIGYIEIPGHAEDIEISPERTRRAFNKDTVEIKILPEKREGRVQGEVVRVLERAKADFVGEIVEDKGNLYLEPDDRRVPVPFALGKASDHPSAKNGYKALVHMTAWGDDDKYPRADIREVIGMKGEHETEMRAFVLAKGFELGFPSDVMAEARIIDETRAELFAKAEQEIKDGTRRDFRNITTFTIDPEDAKDFDDAISYRALENGTIEVGVHIADVSFYLKPGSAIDTEARKRATSIYLVDRTIPMLPEVLSNDLCSLNPNIDRLATAAVFVLNLEGEVLERWFGQTLIHSDKRFTYENAQEALKNPSGELHKELNILDGIAKKMRAKRADEGAISFEQDEVKFKLDATGKPLGVYKKTRQDTNLLIEDFMLLANKEVAAYVTELNQKEEKKNGKSDIFVYRIHDAPDPERIETLATFLKALGHELKTDGGIVSAKEITKLFKSVEGLPEEDLIKTATIRSMAKAIYSTENIGHFGLAFTHYTHFTSPIRRYPDVMVHRLLKSHELDTKLSERELKDYERMVVQSTEREIAAAEAERDSIKYKQVEYLSQFIGREFEGVVSGVADWGVYVEEPETKAEGLVRMRDLGNDFFVLDKERYRVVGEKSKKVFQLGDKVKIKLTASNLEERTLDFVFV